MKSKVPRGFALLAAGVLLALAPAVRAAPNGAKAPVIIDTDAGSDDLMAIAFLLSRGDVRIEAITVTNGLAHVQDGARNVLRLLALAGKKDIPVYLGRETPLRATAEFPKEWREVSDKLPGVDLPQATRQPELQPAADFLLHRLSERRRVRILALGPLTNLAEVLRRKPAAARAIDELVIMGGAVRVPGNLGDGGYFKTDNKTAEWNLFVDPLAAQIVFSSAARIRLVPLDATSKVPIDLAFLRELQSQARTPLARFVAQVLGTDKSYIQQGFYFAWDPLAAVALAEPAVVKAQAMAIAIGQQAPEEGRTKEVAGRPPNTRVALDADAAAFKRIFLAALGAAPERRQQNRRGGGATKFSALAGAQR